MLKALIVCTLLILSSSVFAGADDKILHAFSANYELYYKKDAVGNAVRELKLQDDGSLRYSYKTSADWFVFSDHREEYSIVNVDQQAIIPSYYSFQRKGSGKNKKHEWLFDIAANTAVDVKISKQYKVDYPERFQDKLSYHLQMRLDLLNNPEQKQISFPVINTSGTIKDYVYVNAGEEQLTLPYGEIKTIKFKREVTDKKRVTYAWFAPELDFMLVKLTQFKKSKEQFDIQLTAID